VPLASILPAGDLQRIFDSFNRAGKTYGIEFHPQELMANSRLAIEATEFARDKGLFHPFHDRVFQAYFTEGLDIGRQEVLLDLAGEVGLNREELRQSLQESRYVPRLQEIRDKVGRYGISATPTFILNGGQRIVGAQPLEVFRKVLAAMVKE